MRRARGDPPGGRTQPQPVSAGRMDAMLTAPAAADGPTRPPLRRDPAARWLGGVCAGIARQLGVDPLLVRVAFVATTLAGGLGIALYGLAWVALPADEQAAPQTRRIQTGRGSVEVALGVGFLLLSVLLTFLKLVLWFSDALAWPLVLVAVGGALLWRQSLGGPGQAPSSQAATTRTAASATARPAAAAIDGQATETPERRSDDVRQRAGVVSR